MRDVAEQDVRIIHVIDKHIEYCTGCFTCMHNGGTCIHDDDMRDILDEILSSDVLLFNFSLYGYGMPALLKTLRRMPDERRTQAHRMSDGRRPTLQIHGKQHLARGRRSGREPYPSAFSRKSMSAPHSRLICARPLS